MSGGTSSRPLPTPKPTARKGSDDSESSPEKENQSPKAHRPLPKEPRPLDSPVPVASFYAGSSSKSKAGSSHTTYLPPSGSSPPSHKPREIFREPELISDVPLPQDESIPPLEPITQWANPGPTSWDNLGPVGSWQSWDNRWSSRVDIDGRNDEEELSWWDKEVQRKRPGPGMLPPLLAETLHHPHHTLYSVTASAPPPKPPSTSAASSPPPPSAASPPPTADEIRTAVPHPHAYYCKDHNGWVLLSWCSSSVLPPISSTFNSTYPFPDQQRRKRTGSCIGDEEHSVGRANVTHHFHKYEKAVDARMLTTPFKRSEWETEALRKQRRRKMTLHLDDDTTGTPTSGEKEETPEPDLLDLYLCCQCSVYCLVSQVIPGVLPWRILEDFIRDKLEHPPLGKTGEIAVVTGFETMITYVSALPHVVCTLCMVLNTSVSFVCA